jgi:protein-disulfide isomerase
MKPATLLTVCLTALLSVSGALLAEAQKNRCLSHWHVGMSGCDGKKKDDGVDVVATVPDTPSQTKPQQQPQAQQPPSLDERIDEFLDNHGKPPREFVAFHLEPTLENAVKWIHKYNETITRSRQLAAMWTQAQQIYDDSMKTGRPLPGMEALPGQSLPPPQDLGVPLPANLQALLNPNANRQPADANSPLRGGAANPFISLPGQTTGAAGGLGVSTGSLTPPTSIGGPEPIRISYYFSAQCPFCKKFEPGLQNIVRQLGNRVQVTCVDMTPSGQDVQNIHGKVDCQWRPLMPGEMDAYKIESTPTLIVNRGGGRPMERIAGYIDELTLKDYFAKIANDG